MVVHLFLNNNKALDFLPINSIKNGGITTAGIQNQGLNNFVPRTNATILRNVISISANGANTGATFCR